MRSTDIFWGITLAVFITMAFNVNFMQNDEWNRYLTIQRFINGDFSLIPETATTFYSQGILGAIFSVFFGIGKLPLLTALVSICNVYVFYKILEFDNPHKVVLNLLLSCLLLFNPIYFYSSIGFMTENYLLFFVLIGYLFFRKYVRYGSYSNFINANIFFILAFFAKQIAFIFPIAMCVYFALHREYKKSLIQGVLSLVLLAYYYFVFPRTPEMIGQKNFLISNIHKQNSSVDPFIINLSHPI